MSTEQTEKKVRKGKGILGWLFSLSWRVFFYGALLLILLLAVAFNYLQSPAFENFIAARLMEGLQGMLHERITISGVDLDILGRRVLVTGLVVHTDEPGRFPNPVSVDHILIKLRGLDLLQGKVTMEHVNVFRPQVRLRQAADGSTNLPTILSITQEQQTLDVSVRQIDITAGVIEFNDQPIGFGVRSGELSVSAWNAGEGVFRGAASIANLVIRPPATRQVSVDVDLNFKASRDRIDVRADVRDRAGNDIAFNQFGWDLRSNEIDVGYDLRLDLALLELTSEHPLEGVISMNGSVGIREGGVNAMAELSAGRIRYGPFILEDVYDHLVYDGERLRHQDVRASFYGGILRGEAELSGLTTGPRLTAKAALQGFDLAELLTGAGLQYFLIDSNLGADVSLDWELAEGAQPRVEGVLRGERPAANEPSWRAAVESTRHARVFPVLDSARVPLAMELKLAWAESRLTIAPGSWIETPRSRVRLEGTIEPPGFRILANASDIDSAEAALALTNLDRFFGSFHPEFEQVYGVASFIRQFDARGSFALDLRGPLADMRFETRIRAGQVDFLGHPVGSGSGTIAFADNNLSFSELKFLMDDGSLAIDGVVRMPPAGTPPGVPPDVELEVAARNLDLVRIAWLLSPDESQIVSGSADADLTLRFSDPAAIAGSGRVTLVNPKFGDAEARRAAFAVRFGDEWALSELDVTGREGEAIAGDLTFSPKTQDWRAKLNLKKFDLSKYSHFLGDEADFGGIVEAEVDITGRLLEARGDATFTINDLFVQGIEFGTVRGVVKADGASGHLRLIGPDGEQRIEATLRRGKEADTLHFRLAEETIDLTDLARHFVPDDRFYLQVYEGIEADITIGPQGFRSASIALGNISVGLEQFSLTSDRVRLEMTPEGRFVLNDIVFRQGGQQGREATLSGWIDLNEGGDLNINLSGGISLYSFSDFAPGFTISGEGQVDLRARGTFAAPQMFGYLTVRNGFMRHLQSDLTFAGVTGEMRFDRQRVEITRLTAQFSQGFLLIDGMVDMNWAALEPAGFKLTAQGTDLQLRPLDGLDARFSSLIAISGDSRQMNVTGDVNLTRARYTARFDPEAELARLTPQAPTPVVDESLKAIKLDIGIHGREGIKVDNNFADMDLALDLRLLGNLAEPGMTGRAEVTKGEVYYRDRKYRIDTGVIEFTDPARIVPQFDFRAETQVKEYRIFLEFHGTMERMYPELSSDPDVSSLDIINLLAVGKIRDNPFPSESEALQERLLGLGLSGFLTKQITGELERRAETIFGIDRFRIDPFLLDRGNNPTARVTVGEQLTDSLSVVYSSNLSRDDQQVLVFEYRLSPSMLLVATREEDGSYALDIHLQHRFR